MGQGGGEARRGRAAAGPGANPRLYLAGALLLVLLGLADALGGLAVPGLAHLNLSLHDLAVRLHARTEPPASPTTATPAPRIVLVQIDQRALAAHGRWPWPRRQLAQLIEAIGSQQPRVIGLDQVLAEPSDTTLQPALDQLAALAQRAPGTSPLHAAAAALRPALDDDARLAQVLQTLPVVLGFTLVDGAESGKPSSVGVLPPPLAATNTLDGLSAPWPQWRAAVGNLAQLQQAAPLGAGHLLASMDADGVVRRLPLLVQHAGGVQPALALAMARAAGVGSQPVQLALSPSLPPLQRVSLHAGGWQLQVPVDAQAQVLLPFRPASAFTELSAADVLAGKLPAGLLRDTLVLVNVSAPGLADLRRTPVDEAMLGTLVHANLLASLLDGRLLHTPAAARQISAAALLVLGLLLVPALPRLRWRQGLALVLGLSAAGALLLAALCVGTGLVLPMAAPLLLPMLLLALHGTLQLLALARARAQLTQLFGQYVPPELVQAMAREPGRYSMRSREAELTVLFADVRGFTGLAERMPPEALSAMMNLLFSRLTDIVRAHRGTLDKYIGDSVMAFWGAPLDDDEHALHAVQAALAMRAALPALQAELQQQGWPALDLAIGLETGRMVVGDMGSRHRRAYTVMGDAVNRAARLQALASAQGLDLVVGQSTRQALLARPETAHCCLALGAVVVRGRAQPLQAWWLLPQRPGDDAALDQRCATWAALHAADAAGDHAAARVLLAGLEAQGADATLCRWQRARWAQTHAATEAD